MPEAEWEAVHNVDRTHVLFWRYGSPVRWFGAVERDHDAGQFRAVGYLEDQGSVGIAREHDRTPPHQLGPFDDRRNAMAAVVLFARSRS